MVSNVCYFHPKCWGNLTCAYFSCWAFQTNHQLSPKWPKCLGVEGFRQPNLHPELEFLRFGVYLQRWNLLPLSKKLGWIWAECLEAKSVRQITRPRHPKAIHCCRFGIGESFQKIPGEIWNLNSAQKMSHYGTGFSARTDLSQMIWSCPASASKAFSATAKKPRARKKMTWKRLLVEGISGAGEYHFFLMIVRFYCKSDTQDEPTASKRSAIKLEYEQLNPWKATHKDVHA